jgi:hypothetical protein
MLIPLGLLIAFIVVALVTLRRRTTRTCRWRAERTGDADGKYFYRCAACGAEAWQAKDRAPNFCGWRR